MNGLISNSYIAHRIGEVFWKVDTPIANMENRASHRELSVASLMWQVDDLALAEVAEVVES